MDIKNTLQSFSTMTHSAQQELMLQKAIGCYKKC